MNAVVPVDPQPRPALMAGGRIQPIIPQSMEDAFRLGTAICKAGMAPRDMNTPEKCMIAIMRGMEVGLTPMQALDKIAVVNGRPTIWGDGAMALVRGSGLCEFVREEIEGSGDARVAVCETKRRGEADAVRRTFSVAEAKEANLWGKAGPWKQFPARMLQMRARAFALRDTFADVLGGLYLREEIEENRSQDEPPAAPGRQMRQDRPAQIEHRSDEPPPAPGRRATPDVSVAPEQPEEAADEPETLESILAEVDQRLSYARTETEVEEAYVDTDAEARLSDFTGGVEQARALKDRHVERVLPRVQRQAEPADDFPGNDAIAAGQRQPEQVSSVSRDPFAIPPVFKGGGHYQIFIRDAVAAAKRPEHDKLLRDVWSGTADVRRDLHAQGQVDDVTVRLLKDEVVAALGKLSAPQGDDGLPPPAQPRQDGHREPEASTPSSEPEKAASGDPIAAYTDRLSAALAEAKTPEDVERFWASSTDDRDDTGASEDQRSKWRLARNKRKGELTRVNG